MAVLISSGVMIILGSLRSCLGFGSCGGGVALPPFVVGGVAVAVFVFTLVVLN